MRSLAIYLLMLASACGPSQTPPARPGDDFSNSAAEMGLAPSAKAPDVRLTAVWGSGPTDVWVSGLEATLLHFDGSTWEQHDLGPVGWIQSLGGTGPDDVCAGTQSGSLYCRDGDSWTQVPLPVDDYFEVSDIEAGHGDELFIGSWTGPLLQRRGGVWEVVEAAPSNLGELAVGSDGDLFALGGPDGEMLRFHDGLWIAESPPFEGDSQDVWASSSKDVNVVDSEGLLYIFDGEEWRVLAPPIAAMQGRYGYADLLGVWGTAPDDVFAVGHGGLVLHTGGGNWSLQETPTTEVLEAIWGSSADDVYAVGWRGTILHYDGSRWTYAAASRTSE